MELSRREILRYGAVTGASLMLPRFVRSGEHRPNVKRPAEPVTLHSYEEGTDGAPITTANGVLAVAGRPVYSAADAAHGTMGWLSPAQDGGRLTYPAPDPAGCSGSVYLVPREIQGKGAVTVVSLSSTSEDGDPSARVRLTGDGRVEIANAARERKAASARFWTPLQRVRLDWRQVWDGTTLTLTVWAYVRDDGEAWRPDASVQAALVSGSPSFVWLGSESPQAAVGYDTFRAFRAPVLPPPYESLIGTTALHDFDAWVNGQVVKVGEDAVVGVTGTPKYATSAAKHGALGVLLPPTGGGVLRYDNPYPPAHTGSLYVRLLARGSTDSRIVAFQSGSAVLALIKISRDGRLYLADSAGHVLDACKAAPKLGRWTRLDWQQTWDGSLLALEVKYFATDSESPDNCLEVAGATPVVTAPDTIALGSAAASWKICLDTFRTYGDVVAWPGPFESATRHRPPGRAVWAGDATQTSVELAAYTDSCTSVGLTLSTAPDLSNARALPSATPNAGGWTKWSVGGLTPGTRYYHQLTDNSGGGAPSPVGPVSTFTTLQPAGSPCTIRVAVGSCAQNNPTNTAALDDIVAWGPDRTIHLGDFGYPTNLTTDVTTHMQNWALNVTDPGFSKVLAVGCMDYVISDHDDNGSGYSNLTTYHDPVTAANIDAWRQVVPARLEDTQEPPHGRWRSDVEGNVRFVKLDTRSIDKTDNRAQPTDPRSPDSSMLGATQLAWLKGQIDAAVAAHQLIILCSDSAWNGTSPGPPIPVTFSDKWPSYIYERDLISDYAAAAGAQMFIIFGDSHGLQQDDGTNERNGFASICCGPLDQDLHMHYQDSYQWSYPDGIPDGGGPYRHAQQYQRLTIAQEPGSNQITVIAEARDCSPVVTGTPMTVRTLVKTYTP